MRRARVTAALASVAVLASGCSSVGDLLGRDNAPKPTSVAPQTPPPGMEGTEKFYAQQLQWERCSGGQCAELEVPLDYAKPDGETIKVSVLRVPAKKQSKRIGSLVVNPGGPGGSGVDYARSADFIVGSGVRDRYDVVGFDPRGVGRSAPIDCLTDSELDDFLGGDPTPDDAAEQTEFASGAKEFAAACGSNAGPLLGHVSTVDAAKDMDILRARLGEDKLDYLGKSYGTYLGATYADLFPELVGRFVLDGVVAPDLTSAEINLGQAKGFETATRAWAQYCIDEGDCPLGSSVDEVMQGIRDFLERVDEQPLTKTGDAAVPELTEGWASTGIAAAMYDQGMWATLVEAMRAALKGDGSELMGLANTYADRNPGGGYNGNIMEVIYAVNCLDKPESSSVPEHAAAAEASTKEAPTWGPFLMWSSLTCGSWPVKTERSSEPPKKVTAEGAPPIVVVGTTRDPATPYEWSVRLADQLAKSSLITYDGDGHTAYMRSNSCVDKPIDEFYLTGKVPQDGLKC
ncbi:alpha/beta hydrolase family protein [Knoellia remsis]|uniref:Alpha/beta hydrolase family protein n=1 Tax=Knoellia remsis TaxID=407159 RepID=A0A2T0UNP2_9MICO|nr:alpha/beta hydrolase [Knoellia remsis]PRY59524.1 alpha/beta hydrolase family protein [Knoellia remsis]